MPALAGYPWLREKPPLAARKAYGAIQRYEVPRPLLMSLVTAIGLPAEEYGTHSLRRTKASIIYKATGNLRAVQILLGHSKIENRVRYLGVDIDDALSLSEATEI